MKETTLKPYDVRFSGHLTAITRFLEEILAPQEPEILWQAMRHGVLAGGKRIRPVLLIETCLASGGQLQQALATAAALELIHCYSLIHDDLPCMDNDDMRRGIPTVHKAFSEDMAILAGDALLAMAFGLIVDRTYGVPEGILLKVISRLSAVASVKGLVNGQVDDILFSHNEPNEAILRRIHSGKTGALFSFSTWAGAMLSGSSDRALALFEDFGMTLGMAFQIGDDLLDIQSSSAVLGKTAGKDREQGKMTFPAVYGIETSQRILKDHIDRLYAILDELKPDVKTDNLSYLVRFMEERQF